MNDGWVKLRGNLNYSLFLILKFYNLISVTYFSAVYSGDSWETEAGAGNVIASEPDGGRPQGDLRAAQTAAGKDILAVDRGYASG